MNIYQAIATAHIHLDSATYRVYVKDASIYPYELMNHNAPEWVLWVSCSDRNDSLLVTVIDGYDLNELAEWVSKYETI